MRVLAIFIGAFLALHCQAGGPPAVFIAQPQDTYVQLGGTTNFQVAASSGTTMTYQWQKNGTNISGATQSSFTIANAQLSDQAAYCVKVVNGGGTVVTTNAALIVMGIAPSISVQPQSQALDNNNGATFSVTASGTWPLSYQWTFNGTNMSGQTNSSLSLSGITTNNAGFYAVTVSNVVGSVMSSNAVLTVHAPPYIFTQPQNQYIVEGQTATFTVSMMSKGSVTYKWFNSAGTQLSGNSSNLVLQNATYSQAGGYYVVLVNVQGSTTSSVANLYVSPLPPTITTQPQNLALDNGNNATFTVAVTGTAPLYYQWTYYGTNIPGMTNSSMTLNGINTNYAGMFAVIVTNFMGAVTSAPAVLTVHAPPYILAQPQSVSLLSGQSASFSVSAMSHQNMSYQWYLNGLPILLATASNYTALLPVAGSAYSVVISTDWGSTTSAVATVSLVLAPTINTQPQPQSVALGQPATFSVSSGSLLVSYQWNFNDAPIAGATASTFTVNAVQTTNAGNYSVTLNNVAGSVRSVEAPLTVNFPASISTPPQNQTAVAGQGAAFSVAAGGTGPFFYQWSFNNVALAGATTSTLNLTGIQTNQAGAYAVTVGNSWGPPVIATASLTVIVPPTITLQPKSQVAYAGQEVEFRTHSSGTTPMSYQWLWNGAPLPRGTSASLEMDAVKLAYSGKYQLVVSNAAGSVTSDAAMLVVTNPPAISTAGMTPNGFSFQLPVASGHTCVIMASTDMQSWSPIYTNVASGTNISFTDPASYYQTRCFYRVQIQ